MAALARPVVAPLTASAPAGDGGEAAARPPAAPQALKSQAAFRTISEVAGDLDVAQHVLRFWESKFPQVRPLKRGGGRRYYRPEDVELLRQIRALLYDEGYTIKGAQKLLRARRSAAARPSSAARGVAAAPLPSPAEPPPAPPSSRRSAPVPVPPSASDPAGPAGLPGELRALKAELVELRDLLRRARAVG